LDHSKTVVLFLILVAILSLNLFALVLRNSAVPSASAVEPGSNIGVYWNQSCTSSVDSIPWGNLQPGGTQQVPVYVLNNGSDTLNLTLATQDWQPGNAYDWLNFSWSCGSTTVEPGQVVEVTLSLGVYFGDFSGGFSHFSFSIVFEGGSLLEELVILAGAWDSHCANYDHQVGPASSNWNPNADVNKDGIVNLLDLVTLAVEYGENSTG